jgi:SAM-dependent methyltransferase
MTAKSPDLGETYISSERADVWHRGKARREETTGAATEMMIDLANIRVGDRVLEVAAGTGDLSMMVAKRVGPNGHVLATDISVSMLNRAAQAAREAGLTNVETRVMNSENLELDAKLVRCGPMSYGLDVVPPTVKGARFHAAHSKTRRKGCRDGAFRPSEKSIPWIAAGDCSPRRKHGDSAA